MPDTDIQIIRDQSVLGSLPAVDARELLSVGFFRPEDLFWKEGMPDARPLSELDAVFAGDPKAAVPWHQRARRSVSSAAGAIASSASDVAGRIKSIASRTPSALSNATNRVLEGYLPQIRTTLVTANSRGLQSLKEKIHDDAFMRKAFGAAYDCLPRPVCRFVEEERFIEFCLTHRSRLLGVREPEEKEPRELPPAPSQPPNQPS